MRDAPAARLSLRRDGPLSGRWHFVLDLFEPSGSLRAGLLAQTMDFAVAMGSGSAFVRKWLSSAE
jgi:hypothetical protein